MSTKETPFDVALVTHGALPNGSHDDQLLADAIRHAGLSLRFAVWNDPSVDWHASSIAIVRSTWDYHYAPLAWLKWIDSVSVQARLINSPSLLAWNTDKRYLRELRDAGIAIVPTWFVEKDELPTAPYARSSEWIIKPAIGASARGVKRISAKELEDVGFERLRTYIAGGAALLQPYLRELETVQERSLVFIGGEFTHAFTKPAFSSDASGQTEVQLCNPCKAELELARATLATIPHETLYARVDIVPTNNGPLLMELELIEPDLALRLNPQAAIHLARELCRTKYFPNRSLAAAPKSWPS